MVEEYCIFICCFDCFRWSHHIRSKIKRKTILDWTSELNLKGFCKLGYPGIIIVEGLEENCCVFVSRIKRLQWAAINVKVDEKENESYFSELSFSLAFNKQKKFIELKTKQMGELTKELQSIDLNNNGKTRIFDTFRKAVMNLNIE